jgi:hypothetical protein
MLMMFNADYGREQAYGQGFRGPRAVSGLVAASVITVGLSGFVIYQYDLRTASLPSSIPGRGLR